jgi:hypothetical protein
MCFQKSQTFNYILIKKLIFFSVEFAHHMTLHVIQHAHQCDKDFSHELLCVKACTLM